MNTYTIYIYISYTIYKYFCACAIIEQYPATKDEWAESISSDDSDMAMLRPFLKNTNLESRALQLTYDANRDGWDASSFHQAVDKKGGAIVLCVTRMGIVCGGYNPKGECLSMHEIAIGSVVVVIVIFLCE